MRYLLVTPEFPPDTGGVARYLGVLAEGNQEKITVASPHGKVFVDTTSWIPLLWRVRRLLKETKSDALLLSHVLPYGYAALFCGRPFVVICHGLDLSGPLGNAWKKFWVQMILRKAARVIANSEATKRIVLQYGIEESNICVVHPPYSFDPAQTGMMHETDDERLKLFSDRKTALIVNRLVPRKGIDVALRAFAKCLQTVPDAVLAIAGTGSEEQALKTLCAELNISHNVHFLGQVSDAFVGDLYRVATVVLYPSVDIPGDAEGFGIAAADAAVFGKPAIVSDTGGLREAVLENETGLLVPPGDAVALQNALCDLLQDTARASRLAETARTHALQRTHEVFRREFFDAIR